MSEIQPHAVRHTYRPDIDGLRALAILPVLLFHYRVPGFSGGFVGVDVFFVISGYLIAGLIHGEMREGRFSIANFYERRIRRIFPALFTVLIAATAAAWVLLFPSDFERYARSLFATAFFAVNYEFWRELGYFDVSAETKPLLHLWSIAVEEQFYVFFPPILLLAGRRALAVVGAIFLFSRATPFPGAFALLPCAGAALIIAAENSAVNSALSWRPFVLIGLISYSLYLWHWPLFVFARDALDRDLTAWETAALIAASFALAAFSWRVIERPFRERGFRPARWKLFGGALAAMAIAAVCGAAIVQAQGVPQRLPPAVQTILAAEHDEDTRAVTCFGMTGDDVRAGRLCRIGDVSKTPSFILWGDSHAGSIIPAVDAVAKAERRSGLFAATDSCPPLLGVTRPDAWKCKAFNDAVIVLALKPAIQDVILDARWAKNAEGTSYGDEPPGRILLYDDLGRGIDTASTHAVFLRGLTRTVEALHGAKKKVILIGSAPEIGWAVPQVLAKLRLHGDWRPLNLPLETHLARQRAVMQDFALMKITYGVEIVDPTDVLCDASTCRVMQGDAPLYRDEHHLSGTAARLLIPELSKVF